MRASATSGCGRASAPSISPPRCGAKKVVLHLGAVQFFWFDPATALDGYIEDHAGEDLAKDTAYQKLLAKSVARMRKRMPPYWENMKAGLVQLLPYAEEKGVKLGFENREAFDELPLDADHPELFSAVARPNACGYWHDTGHAQIKQNMGLLDHRAHLERNAPNAIGFHLHDVSADGRDHQPIGSGKIDFDMVSSFWRPEHTLVLEFSPRLDDRADPWLRKAAGGRAAGEARSPGLTRTCSRELVRRRPKECAKPPIRAPVPGVENHTCHDRYQKTYPKAL